MPNRSLLTALVTTALLLAQPARAFCGFYVSSAGAELFNDATMVVLVHDGTRTVLSMQNTYRGPPEDFAMVVPVPVVLQKEQVKTLPQEVFARVDTLAAPRLVEEFDPGQCQCPPMAMPASAGGRYMEEEKSGARDLGVKVEARFDVAEYEIVVLSAKDALGLDTWLKENKYKIPGNAEPLLRPYVQTNWKFFVARVNAKKVRFEGGRAVLSPLRFQYDSESFALPVRLGLINSSGTQDLIVHIIAKSRYEVANRPNVLVPTNLSLAPSAEVEFGPFYASLVQKTFEKNPGATLTEFAWAGAVPPPTRMQEQGIYHVTCDPCPPPVPVDDPLAKYLGVDALPGVKTDEDVAKFTQAATLTRLHLRYTKESLTDDLVFKAVGPVAGGIPEQAKAGPAAANRFQGRYIVHKPFDVNRCCSMGMATQVGWLSAPTPAGSGATTASLAPVRKLTQPMEAYLLKPVDELGLKPLPPTKTRPAPERKP
jgi:hypothetical protein